VTPDAEGPLRIAIDVARRRIGKGERPLYRVRAAPVGRAWAFRVLELPGSSGIADSRLDVTFRARELVAELLDVDRDEFDVALDTG
jgi:hypothetical protein